MDKKIVAIIPARGGSKGIPRKNVKNLCGKPMIGYIIETALSVKRLDRVIVTTEDDEIASVAKACGAEVPFKRPAELAEDHVETLPVLQHAVEYLREHEGYEPDYVLLIYPTSPLLSVARIEQAIDIAMKRDSDSVVSGHYDYGQYFIEVEGGYERLHPKKIANRQQMKPLFRLNGAIFLTKASFIKKQPVADKVDILPMDPEENVDVDEMSDWNRVEEILTKKK